jgi:hypothetical protein
LVVSRVAVARGVENVIVSRVAVVRGVENAIVSRVAVVRGVEIIVIAVKLRRETKVVVLVQ